MLGRAGRIDKLQELIESGAELDAGDRNGSTALMYAAEKKRVSPPSPYHGRAGAWGNPRRGGAS